MNRAWDQAPNSAIAADFGMHNRGTAESVTALSQMTDWRTPAGGSSTVSFDPSANVAGCIDDLLK
jgi:hypothetical protein